MWQGVNLSYYSKFKLWDPELNTSNGAFYPTPEYCRGIAGEFLMEPIFYVDHE